MRSKPRAWDTLGKQALYGLSHSPSNTSFLSPRSLPISVTPALSPDVLQATAVQLVTAYREPAVPVASAMQHRALAPAAGT